MLVYHKKNPQKIRSHRDRDHMVVLTTNAISAYHHSSCMFESHSW